MKKVLWVVLIIASLLVFVLVGSLLYTNFASNKKGEDTPGRVTLVGTKVTDNSILVMWDAEEHATFYTVYRKSDGEKWTKLDSVEGVTYEDVNAIGGVKYYYTVIAENEYGKSDDYDKIGLEATITALPAEVRLTEASSKDGGVLVSWEPVATAESYFVYRKTEKEKWKMIQVVTDTVYQDTDVATGKEYTYTVRAVNGNGRSEAYDKTGLRVTVE